MMYDTISGRSQYAQNNIEGAVWPYTKGITNQTTNVQVNNIWPGASSNPLVPITSLAGNSPNPVVASSPWLAASFVNAPNYNDARSQQYNLQLSSNSLRLRSSLSAMPDRRPIDSTSRGA